MSAAELGAWLAGALGRAPRALTLGAAAHLVVALACAAALALPASPVLGLHPAVKPLKFAVSIAVFLGTMALLLPRLALTPGARAALSTVLAGAMALEMAAIGGQALRGAPSHFGARTPLDAAVWTAMVLTIVGATIALVVVAWVATTRPLALDDAPDPVLLALAVRIGLVLLLLAPLSGFMMGGRGAHTVGGVDGGPGLAVVNWSRTHGDLRVPHFVALHALQLLPLAAWALGRWVPWAGARRAAFAAVAVVGIALAAATFAQALAGRPVTAARAA